MIEILELRGASAGRATDAVRVLEAGGLVVLPDRSFDLEPAEQCLLDPDVLAARSKNVSLNPMDGTLRGVRSGDQRGPALTGMIARFAKQADDLLAELTPRYTPELQRKRTSFRPGAIADRALSRRKDDRRLHVDAFPANPVQGRRILRVFANVNPKGVPRIWDVGEEDFEMVAKRFQPSLTARGRLGGVKAALGITKGRQTAYDQIMVQLHDTAKLDDNYQATVAKRRVTFAAGGTWMVYTDAVSHAALTGQYALEQTYLLPVEAMQNEAASPLRVLERLKKRRLV